MTISIYRNGEPVQFKQWVFPAGEVGVQLPPQETFADTTNVTVLVHGAKSNDLFALLNILNVLATYELMAVTDVVLNYFPYGRQDRATKEGESFALLVWVNMLASVPRFNRLFVSDPHSQVTTNLIEQSGVCESCFVYTQSTIVQTWFEESHIKFDYLIAPDAGALSKLEKVDHPKKVFLTKERVNRDVVYNDYAYDTLSGDVLVVDDIFDAGSTFLALGQMLTETQPRITSLSLYVTHALFSNPEKYELIKSMYKKVYTWNNMSIYQNDEQVVLI